MSDTHPNADTCPICLWRRNHPDAPAEPWEYYGHAMHEESILWDQAQAEARARKTR